MDQQNNIPNPAPIPPAAPVATVSQLPPARNIFRDSWAQFKAHWQVLFTIAIIPGILTLISQFLTIFGAIDTTNQTVNPVHVFNPIAIILSIIGAVLYVLTQAAIIDAVHKISTDSSIKIDPLKQYGYSFSIILSIVLVFIIQTLVVIGGLALFIVPGIILSLYLVFSMYALVIDGKKGFGALSYSYNLVKNRWGEVFGKVFYLAIAVMIIMLILSIISALLVFIISAGHQSALSTLVGGVINIIASAVVTPLAIIYNFKLYEALKSTKTAQDATNLKIWLIVLAVWGVIVNILIFVLIVTVFAFLAAGAIGGSGNVMNGTSVRPSDGTVQPDYFPNGQGPGSMNNTVQ